MNAWKVCCEKCRHAWTLVGNWSPYEREAVESRPCPKCHSYTLSSPEPKAHRTGPARPHFTRTFPNYRMAG